MIGILCYVYAGCSYDCAAKVMEILHFFFKGLFGEEDNSLPADTTIRTWVLKGGLDTFKNRSLNLKDAYHLIVDGGITVEGQQAMAVLKAPATHAGKPLNLSDVEVIGIAVDKQWNAADVENLVRDSISSEERMPEYAVTDGGKNLVKAFSDMGIDRHYDVSHAFGVMLRAVYEDDPEFVAFTKDTGRTRKYALSKVAYLMPPCMRTKARFMNVFGYAKWANSLLENYHKLGPDERYFFSFIRKHGAIVQELSDVMGLFKQIQALCKKEGFSRSSLGQCLCMTKRMLGCASTRQIALCAKIIEYLKSEAPLLTSEEDVHNISSDVLESGWGYAKGKLPFDKRQGFTLSILTFPLRTRLASLDNATDFDIAKRLERTSLPMVEEWRKNNLVPNMVNERKQIIS